MRKKSERTYAKNAAIDRTYLVKINGKHHGEKLEDIRDGLHQKGEIGVHEYENVTVFDTKYILIFG